MLFNSPAYIFLFLPISLVIYFLLNKSRSTSLGKAWLVLASLFFYGYVNTKYLLLIMLSIAINFAVGLALNGNKFYSESKYSPAIRKKIVLACGIIFNLGLLGYFKYADFFIANFNLAFGAGLPALKLAFPLAISFFTFQQIAYLVDGYHGNAKENNFLNYCLFVTFFPKLIAGPIVRHHEMMPQFGNARNSLLNWGNAAIGIFIFSLGLFKKIVIADSFAVWANAGYNTGNALSLVEAWGTSLSYTFQLYYDFSGYSDMAIGAALMFNIRIPVNFNSPYRAHDIQDFWRRWHMTLSSWLRNFIYIPLGGNRKGNWRKIMNILDRFKSLNFMLYSFLVFAIGEPITNYFKHW